MREEAGHRRLCLRRLLRGLVLEPRLGCRALLDHRVTLLLLDVRVLLLRARREGLVALNGRHQLLRRLGALLVLIESLHHRIRHRLELIQLGHVHRLGLVLALVVQPVLHVVQLLAEGRARLLLHVGIVLAAQRGPHAVHELLKRVLALRCILHQLVLLEHCLLLRLPACHRLGAVAKGRRRRHGHVGALGPLLGDELGLGLLHGRVVALLLLRGLGLHLDLVLLLLDHLRRLNLGQAVEV
mmetsp:Transcript_11891/g.36706  ORF Transcript_11891/g.36706 Transcript_11891/m.36706 type:complete len:241 (-) Transcript_11891:1559-2281(-)